MKTVGRTSLIVLLISLVVLFGLRHLLSLLGIYAFSDWLRPLCGAAALVCGITVLVDLSAQVFRSLHRQFGWQGRLKARLNRQSHVRVSPISSVRFKATQPIVVEAEAEVSSRK